MCGIIACLGDIASPYIINGLKQLQNRGYDSAGLSLMYNHTYIVKKYVTEHSLKYLAEPIYPPSINGIGHTRWATHGAKNVENAHPHKSYKGTFMVVHNGIIENYKALKEFLEQKGYVFYSETDSEIIANVLEYYNTDCSVIEAIEKTIEIMEGTWALCIQTLHEPNVLYCFKHGSPLLVGNGGHFALVSSEPSGFCGKIKQYIDLKSNDICKIEYINQSIHITTRYTYSLRTIQEDLSAYSYEPYSHWTQKEIYEQANTINHVIELPSFSSVKHIILLGCGTSYYSACIGSKYIKKRCNFVSVQALDAGEFTKDDIPCGKCAFILVSQSGETKDLQKCIPWLEGHITIGVLNKVDSTIAREVDYVCYLNAGREVGVASTKSFSAQVMLLSSIAQKLSNTTNDLLKLSVQIKEALSIDMKPYLHLLDKNCFVLGKGYDEYTAKEGALKIKELSYIHAEGYSSSSLKHGPFALLEPHFPVILISPKDEHWSKNENIYEELKSRLATIITITNEPLNRPHTIVVPKNEDYQCILNIIPLQLLAYELAVSRGFNPDQPRNLAKVVSVE
jgi:glucosamine--fructose-6-phosphate aminotransferase (isomerizing)